MEYIDKLRLWMDAMAHPGKATKRALGVKEALRLYYSLAVIPIVLGLIVMYAVGGFNPFSASSMSMSKAVPPLFGVHNIHNVATGVGYTLLLFLIITPFDMLVNSAIYHLLIGKLFKIYNKRYSKVFAAVFFGALPALLVDWLYPAGILGVVIISIFGLWGLVVEIIALSNQLGMSRIKALGTIVLYVAAVVVVAFAVGLLVPLALKAF
jgi:hypothetical protein